ncbi:MAG: nucleotidyl transferase AbiEii/AbiGii toxin family protein [Gammaproteobacteria bacterium]|nr:nucleotidyl transferase AbiEii/AbiGii toxin family protein [Gammaproteobacteria bacterium]
MDNLREQFLERLTREIFHKQGGGFVLKGGGALRALFGEQRLTKDISLDFVHPKRSAESLHHSIAHAIRGGGTWPAASQSHGFRTRQGRGQPALESEFRGCRRPPPAC